MQALMAPKVKKIRADVGKEPDGAIVMSNQTVRLKNEKRIETRLWAADGLVSTYFQAVCQTALPEFGKRHPK